VIYFLGFSVFFPLDVLSVRVHLVFLLLSGIKLATHNSSTPVCTDADVVGKLKIRGGNLVSKGSVMFLSPFSEHNSRGSFVVNQVTETRFTLHNHVRDALSSAESREPDDEFEGINIVGNDNKFRFFGLN